MKKLLNSIGNYFKNFGVAVVKGDIWVKISLFIMGAGYIARGQIINGLIMTALEAVFGVMCVFYALPNLAKFGTLGTVQFEQVFDPLTLTSTVNDYDNSFLILLNSIIALFVILIFILVYIQNVKVVYNLQEKKKAGKHINTFREDLRSMFNERFHITLMTLPVIGIVLMNILPILVLIAVAFTNYDQQHMPPSALFTWVGWKNFISMFTSSTTITFGYSFRKILVWTLVWAFMATFTTYIGGILLAKFINNSFSAEVCNFACELHIEICEFFELRVLR